jgi:arginine decarboxylase
MKCLGITKKIAIVSGFGESNSSKLNAFDNALINAKIHDCNLIKVSSILSKNTKIMKKFSIEKGAFVPCVLSTIYSKENEEKVAGIGLAFNNQKYGFVMEAQGNNEKKVKKELEKKVQEMAENRDQKIIKKRVITKKSRTTKKYGCALTAIIYLF